MSDQLSALIDSGQVVRGLVMLGSNGCYTRDEGDWLPMDPDIHDYEDYDLVDTIEAFVPIFDSAQETDGRLVLSDVR